MDGRGGLQVSNELSGCSDMKNREDLQPIPVPPLESGDKQRGKLSKSQSPGSSSHKHFMIMIKSSRCSSEINRDSLLLEMV